uniref:Uncharacterized protein n=1 Tax=Leersia perrieri TaxID=77586 RepID=A0A0D9X9R1_9ORYZ
MTKHDLTCHLNQVRQLKSSILCIMMEDFRACVDIVMASGAPTINTEILGTYSAIEALKKFARLECPEDDLDNPFTKILPVIKSKKVLQSYSVLHN